MFQRIHHEADFAFGFDTSGVRQAVASGDPTDVFSGFYVSDTANVNGTGLDVPELELFGSFTAAAVAGFDLDLTHPALKRFDPSSSESPR